MVAGKANPVKAIVVRQPWATLIALGVKSIETRPGPPNGPMRPDGVRGLPGRTLERGERIAVVAGAAHGLPDYSKIGPYVYQRIVATERTPAHGALYTPQGYDIDCPLGAVVCTVQVADALPIVAPMTDPPHDHLVPSADGHLIHWAFTPRAGQHLWSARSRHPMLNDRTVLGGVSDHLDPQLPLGDFTPGRWGWMLTDPQPCEPVPCKGRQGVFELPDDVEVSR